MLRPITKWARTVAADASAWPNIPPRRFARRTAGRPGPVFLECPMDVLNNLIPDAQMPSSPREGYRTDGAHAGRPALVERGGGAAGAGRAPGHHGGHGGLVG